MEQLFKQIAWKAYQHNLRFEFNPASNGVLIQDSVNEIVAAEWLDFDQIERLKTVERDLEHYLKNCVTASEEDIEAAEKWDRLTNYERNLKVNGLKNNEFY